MSNIIEELEPGDKIRFVGESAQFNVPDEPVKVKKKGHDTHPDGSETPYVRVGGVAGGRYKLTNLAGEENVVSVRTGSPPGDYIEIEKVE